MRRIVRSVAGAVLAVSLAASVPALAQSPAASPVAPPSAAAGALTSRVLVPSGGFIVSLPADWRVLDFEADPEAALAAFLAVHPELDGHDRAGRVALDRGQLRARQRIVSAITAFWAWRRFSAWS